MNRFVFTAILAIVLSVSCAASPITFAQFDELTGANLFEFVNNGNTSGTLRTLNGASIAVKFTFSNISGLPLDLQGVQNAHLTLSATTTDVVGTAGPLFFQSINGPISILITRDSDLKTLLGVSVTPSQVSLYGTRKGTTASLTADDSVGDVVTFASDFIHFASGTSESLAWSFTSANPCFTIFQNVATGCNTSGATLNFLHSLTMAGTGGFAAEPVPYGELPEPGTWFTLAGGLAMVLYGRRRLAR